MCRLLAVVANKPVKLTFSLLEAKNSLFNQSERNPDGWGIAAYQKNSWSLIKEAASAHDSEKFKQQSHNITGQIIISHIRRASVGNINENNTHPFQHNNWVLAHNGTIRNAEKLILSDDIQPQGQTDSERLFCAILAKIKEVHGSLDNVPSTIVAEAINSIVNQSLQIDPQAKINLLLSDGHLLYLYRHAHSLYWLLRSQNNNLDVSSNLLQLLKNKSASSEKALLIASEALTGNEEKWQEVAADQVWVIDPDNIEQGLQDPATILSVLKQQLLIADADLTDKVIEETGNGKATHKQSKKVNEDQSELFIEPTGQLNLLDKSIEQQEIENEQVECLGITFENDTARRNYFLEKLKEKLQDPEFRKIEGFPIGEDEDILRLSDPPYYTACPNPFIEEFIKHYGNPYSADEVYSREPFAADVSEGKTDPIYTAHSYHTKVPHLAIVPSILHYTKPGDIVLDGFCGSGMTGVAAQWCGAAPQAYRHKVEENFKVEGREKPVWGARRAILNDLSPAATFIAAGYNLPFNIDLFAATARKILNDLKKELGWMYETRHSDGRIATIEYTVWSEVFSCPECTGEIVFFEEALDKETNQVKEEFPCPHCSIKLTKRNLEKSYESKFDNITEKTIRIPKRKLALINYSIGGDKFTKIPDEFDLQLIINIEQQQLHNKVPVSALPYMHMTHERARMDTAGITHIHHFFLPRASQSLGTLWNKTNEIKNIRLRNMLLFFIEQAIWGMSVLNRYQPIQHGQIGGSQVNRQLTGVYYVASQHAEVSPWYNLTNKLDRLIKAFKELKKFKSSNSIVNTSSTAALNIPDKAIDYIFTDPPFGENIYYADLNYLVESWHRVWTNTTTEAIVDKAKKKGLFEYQHLMQRCFQEYYRVLKPGRWITIVFHNSRNSVWNAIQEAMLAAGFMVASVKTMDKQQGSYRQVTSNAVKQDLIISAYRPNGGLEERFKLESGTAEGAWDFVRTHLRQLPKVLLSKDGQIEIIAERTSYLLYDRMVAFHVHRGVTVPLDASEFHTGLSKKFPERDGMYFLPEDVAEYDKKRMTIKGLVQLALFVDDEESAIQWIRAQLTKKPQTLQELTPQFMRELDGWQKHEKSLELSELLKQNFLCFNGKSPIPPQIVSWLKQSSTHREKVREIENGSNSEIGLETEDKTLLNVAKDHWYIPDPNKAADLEKLREKALLKEFEEYCQSEQKRLKKFRLEAVRAGFYRAWQDRNYKQIVDVARKIPDDILADDPKLLRWRDNAITRLGDE